MTKIGMNERTGDLDRHTFNNSIFFIYIDYK